MKKPGMTEAHKHLTNTMRSLRRALAFCVLFSFGINMLSLMLPIYSLQVFDRVAEHDFEQQYLDEVAFVPLRSGVQS